MKIYYFGCKSKSDKGHYVYDKNLFSIMNDKLNIPDTIYPKIDGGFCPDTGDDYQKQGIIKFTRIDGWTIISFWDRSADSRLNSNSNFLTNNMFVFPDDLLEEAKIQYPSIFDRFNFEVTLNKEGE